MKRYVLVAGYDYERRGVDFRIFCNSRVKRIAAANKAKDALNFQVFDVRRGEVVTHDITFPGGKKTERVTRTQPFTAITAGHYDRVGSGPAVHYSFKNGQSGMMSVTDVYAAVRAIGATTPGELIELSFFSHAWHGGPILLNSTDDGVFAGPPAVAGGPPTIIPVGAARDPDDKDPRDKDFRPPNMTAAQLKEFQDAFHADGYSWNWGCAFPRTVHEILHKLEHNRDYRPSGIGDTIVLTFTNFRANHIDLLERTLGMLLLDPTNVDLEFGELKRFFCLMTQASYTHQLAASSGRKAFGGVMGTYSDYDKGHLPLMHVEPSFARHFTFYANYLGFTFDPEGRKYGEFSPTFSC